MEPPADIQAIIDRTAEFVAKNGSKMEEKIYEEKRTNPKFNFLRPHDSFHFYYQSRLAYFKGQDGSYVAPPPPPTQLGAGSSSSKSSMMDIDGVDTTTTTPVVAAEITQDPKRGPNYISQRIVATIRKSRVTNLSEMSLEQYIVDPPPDLPALDLDIIKLTAQFVARNGHQFQIGLMNREHKNPQYDFLKNNHYYHAFFLALVESYTKCVLAPPKVFIDKLNNDYKDRQSILDRLILRYDVEKKEEEKKAAELAEHEKDITESFSIDWHDFVVVQTIDFFDNEDEVAIPEPEVKQEIPAEPEDMEMEVEMDTGDAEKPRPAAPPQMLVRKDHVPISARTAQRNVQMQQCSICGQMIPIDEIEQHMKLELYNPRNPQQAAAAAERSRPIPLATGEDIGKNLAKFAAQRTDVFGSEEYEIGQTAKNDKAKKDDKVIWDGHSGSAPRTMSSVLAGRTLDDQIAAIHASKGVGRTSEDIRPPNPGMPPSILMNPGLPPPPGTFIAPPPSMIPPPPSAVPRPVPPPTLAPMRVPTSQAPVYAIPLHHMAPPAAEQPAKRQKVDEPVFIPEAEFLAKHNGPVTIQIQVPNEGTTGKLQGQIISFTLDLKDTIASVKKKLEDPTGLKENKQKFQFGSIADMKNAQSLASYNLTNGSLINLVLKERGGKGKK